ncbi:hypothetical protein [Luteimonas suaedae]|uniref:hypothetical protein n=1 Tax=Luteimonas suaedae TaxID=2605430 RepID=UPI0011EF3A5F|nr:hypothetical protein [Luteimonas suaedae]
MSDDMRITSPVSIKTDSASRVAYDLMRFIGEDIESGDKSNREYWLTLYRQCYKATHGHTLKYLLDRNND